MTHDTIQPPTLPALDARPGSATATGSATVAELRGATKRFGAVTALDEVDLQVRAGEVLADAAAATDTPRPKVNVLTTVARSIPNWRWRHGVRPTR